MKQHNQSTLKWFTVALELSTVAQLVVIYKPLYHWLNSQFLWTRHLKVQICTVWQLSNNIFSKYIITLLDFF